MIRRLLRRLLGGHFSFGKPVTPAAMDRDYQAGRWDHLAGAAEAPRYRALIAQLANLRSEHSILDLGCGDGRLPALYRDAGGAARYQGIDLSTEAIARARARALPGTEFTVADTETFAPDARFDAIVFNESIGYAFDAALTVARYVHCLTASGRFLISNVRYGNSELIWQRVFQHLEVESGETVRDGPHVWDVRVLRPRTNPS